MSLQKKVLLVDLARLQQFFFQNLTQKNHIKKLHVVQFFENFEYLIISMS